MCHRGVHRVALALLSGVAESSDRLLVRSVKDISSELDSELLQDNICITSQPCASYSCFFVL